MSAAQPLSLERLIGDVDDFATNCWGVHPMLRRTGEHFEELLSVDDVEDCLDGSLRRPAFRLVRDGESLADDAVTMRLRLGGRDLHDVADPERVAQAFAQGSTVVLQGLDRFWPTTAALAAAIEAELGHPVQVNAYLTPPDAKGLGEHTDDHDVLVLQAEGSKRWWVDGLGDVEMQPGSVMYIPGATAHRAHTHAVASLHLTIGIFPISMRSVVHRALRELGELDRPLPPLLTPRAIEVQLSRALNAAAELLTSRDVNALAAEQFSDALSGRRPQLGGQLRSLVELPHMDGATGVRLRPDVTLERDDDGITLRTRLGGVHVPPVGVAAIDALAKADALRVDDLPGLDPSSRLVLARRLVRERVAVTVEGNHPTVVGRIPPGAQAAIRPW